MSSILGKRPFLDKILASCSEANLSTLQSLMNNPGTPTIVFLYGTDRLLSNSNKGVSYVQLMIDEYSRRYLNGFLIYIDNSNCGFFSFSNLSSHLIEIEINPSTLTYTDIYENLSAEEFRRTVADVLVNGPDGRSVQIKEVTSLPATGEEDTIYLTDSNAQTEGEPVVIPQPVGNGKVLMVNDGEYVLGEDIIAINNDLDTLSTEEVEMVKGKIWYSILNNTTVYPLYNEDEAVAWFVNTWTGCSFYFYEKDTRDNTWFFESSNEKNYGTKLYKHSLVCSGLGYYFYIISTNSTPFTGANDASDFFQKIKDSLIFMYSIDIDTVYRRPSHFFPAYIGYGANYQSTEILVAPQSISENHPVAWDDFDWAHYTDTVTEL